jgi:hypothetical protein
VTAPPRLANVRCQPTVIEAAGRAKELKSIGCADKDHYEIVPVVEIYKDGNHILTAMPPVLDKNRALAIADICAGPIQPDLIVMTTDAHTTNVPINPATGRPWGPGEMQNACDTDGACSTGLLIDCLLTSAVFGDLHHEMLQQKYTGHEKAGGIQWHEPEHLRSGDELTPTGYLVDRLTDAMKHARDGMSPAITTVLDKAAKDDGIDSGSAFWHGVVSSAAISMMAQAAMSVMIYAPPEYMHIVERGLSDDAIRAMFDSPLGQLQPLLAQRFGYDLLTFTDD